MANVTTVEDRSSCRFIRLNPVSYTHLDVYKRQAQGHTELLQRSVFSQKIQIAVHGAQADFGLRHPDGFINHVRGGVYRVPLNCLQDQFPLPGLFHWTSSQDLINNSNNDY